MEFLLARRSRDGWWRDFQSLAGPSTEWVTAMVAWALVRSGRSNATAAAARAYRKLVAGRWWSGGWGYNRTVPADADTTLWVLRLADALERPDSLRLRRARRFLRLHVSDSGAVATYARTAPIRAYTRLAGNVSFAGWCQGHPCVTALAANVPGMCRRGDMVRWLCTVQRADGSWPAYWWTSSHYVTGLATAALAGAGTAPARAATVRAGRWAADQLDLPPEANTAFQLSGIVQTLAAAAVHPLLERAAARLAAAQKSDGGWESSADLRIPPPFTTEPDRYEGWSAGGGGGGSVQVDGSGCVTAALALSALRTADDALQKRPAG